MRNQQQRNFLPEAELGVGGVLCADISVHVQYNPCKFNGEL